MIPVPPDLFQAIGAYLIERPYREVAGLLDRMQAAAAAEAAAAMEVAKPKPVPPADA